MGLRKKLVDAEFNVLMTHIKSYVGRYPLPTQAENTENLKKLKELKGNPDKEYEYKKLRDKIILSNGGFGMKYTMKYYKMLNDEECVHDLFQEATKGIAEAVDAFNDSFNVNFTTYAFFHVRKCIIDYIKVHKLVKAPREVSKNLKHVADARDLVYTRNKGVVSAEEVGAELRSRGIDIKDNVAEHAMILLDLSAKHESEQFICEYVDQVVVESGDDLIQSMMVNMIEKEMTNMPPVLKQLVAYRYGLKRDFPLSPNDLTRVLNINTVDYKAFQQYLKDHFGYAYERKEE